MKNKKNKKFKKRKKEGRRRIEAVELKVSHKDNRVTELGFFLVLLFGLLI